MERLLYLSTAASDTSARDVFAIIEASQRNNPARDITGFLLYDADRFLQMIEGPTLSVEGLLAVIEDDPRHHSLDIVLREASDERWFPDWEMKRLISFGSKPAQEELRDILGDKEGGADILREVDAFLRA